MEVSGILDSVFSNMILFFTIKHDMRCGAIILNNCCVRNTYLSENFTLNIYPETKESNTDMPIGKIYYGKNQQKLGVD